MFIVTHWNVGRGRKSTFKAKDVLFMALAVMKHGGHWEFLGRMFKIKGQTFEKMITDQDRRCRVLREGGAGAW